MAWFRLEASKQICCSGFSCWSSCFLLTMTKLLIHGVVCEVMMPSAYISANCCFKAACCWAHAGLHGSFWVIHLGLLQWGLFQPGTCLPIENNQGTILWDLVWYAQFGYLIRWWKVVKWWYTVHFLIDRMHFISVNLAGYEFGTTWYFLSCNKSS